MVLAVHRHIDAHNGIVTDFNPSGASIVASLAHPYVVAYLDSFSYRPQATSTFHPRTLSYGDTVAEGYPPVLNASISTWLATIRKPCVFIFFGQRIVALGDTKHLHRRITIMP